MLPAAVPAAFGSVKSLPLEAPAHRAASATGASGSTPENAATPPPITSAAPVTEKVYDAGSDAPATRYHALSRWLLATVPSMPVSLVQPAGPDDAVVDAKPTFATSTSPATVPAGLGSTMLVVFVTNAHV